MFMLLFLSGGGVGGLTLAFALSKSPNIRVDVYEAASKFAEIGAGIIVSWRTRQILTSLGLEEDIIRLLPFDPGEDKVPSVQLRKADQPNGHAMGTTNTRGGMMMFHRAEFHGAILNRLPSSCGTFPSKRLESYTQQPGDVILLRFQDGSTATCNILLGADGVKSAVRKTMLHEAASWAESQHRKADAAELRNLSEPHFSGFFSYRALIPAEKLSSISPQHRALSSGAHVQYLGKNMLIVVYPISRGRFINFVANEYHPHEEGTHLGGPWVAKVNPSNVQSLFHGWEKEVGELIQCLGDLKITRWAVNVTPTLPCYAFGNVAILGDAAHAMTPFLGAGAGQAIEDASVLASLLSSELTTLTTASHALGIYSHIRQPFATEVARRARENGEHFSLFSLTGPDHHHLSSSERLQEIVKQIKENIEWVTNGDASVDLQRAMGLLQAELVT
ncbi:FAD/NAD-P-binding domain-containing protein [Russula aff. rugulosa BPL654]|nr:FAD/NAD-P-binding domain-containing protein [Russula aff. rugulosa BPL654]